MTTLFPRARALRVLAGAGFASVLALSLVVPMVAADAAVVTRARQEAIYSRSLVQSLASDGVLKAEIHGSPVAGADAAQIAGVLPGPSFINNVRFESRQGRNRLVLVFNPAQIRNPDSLCATTADQPVPTVGAGGMQVQGAFCLGDTAISRAVADGPAVSSLADPAFQETMGQLMAALLPPRPMPDQNSCMVPGC